MKTYLQITLFVLATSMCLGAERASDNQHIRDKQRLIERNYEDLLVFARGKYRSDLGLLITDCDRIEISLLDFQMLTRDEVMQSQTDDTLFPIMPYDSFAKVLQTQMLTGSRLEVWKPAINRLLQNNEMEFKTLCHYPIHGLKVFARDTLLMQTSFCWECINFYVTYPGGGSAWENIKGKDLEELFFEDLPIPQSEIDRFKKWLKGSKE